MYVSKVRQELAERFLSLLDEKGLEWKQGWDNISRQISGTTGKAYKGVNAFALMCVSQKEGYDDPRWYTFRALSSNGWRLENAKGKGVRIEYWFPHLPSTELERGKDLTWSEYYQLSDENKKKCTLKVRYSTVFNAQLITGVPPLNAEMEERNVQPEEDVAKIAQNMKVPLIYGGDRAYYSPSLDEIHLPEPKQFHNSYELAATTLHELGHATGAARRLNRQLTAGTFGSESYAFEELIAEITSVFMAQHLGLDSGYLNLENHAAYVSHWKSIIRNNPNALADAINQADAASSYMEKALSFTYQPTTISREEATQIVKGQLQGYLEAKGINTRKLFPCLNPNHQDNHPSMSFYAQKNICKCFSCGVTYDLINLIGIDYNLSGKEMYEKAYDLYSYLLPEEFLQKVFGAEYLPSTTPVRPPVAEISRSAPTPIPTENFTESGFFRMAAANIDQTTYHRGLSEETLHRFQVGYVSGWRHPKAPNAPATDRLIIPTSDYSYIARDTRSAEQIPDEQKRYTKMKVGNVRIFNAPALSLSKQPVFVVEGEIDAMSICEVGGEAIAIGGTSQVHQLLTMLKDQPQATLILCLDQDAAGIAAQAQLEEGLKRSGISYTVGDVTAGKYKDANEALLADRILFTLLVQENIRKAVYENPSFLQPETASFQNVVITEDVDLKAPQMTEEAVVTDAAVRHEETAVPDANKPSVSVRL